jgi:hypothetical protein
MARADSTRKVAKLSALELYREGLVSLGRAAERCGVSQAEVFSLRQPHFNLISVL